jgi:hypothetical protein
VFRYWKGERLLSKQLKGHSGFAAKLAEKGAAAASKHMNLRINLLSNVIFSAILQLSARIERRLWPLHEFR